VVQEALRAGTLGYVNKRKAGIDLHAAVEALCQGRRFVSSGLSADNLTAATGGVVADSRQGPISPTPVVSNCPCDHEVQFYSDDAAFLESLIPFVTSSLKDGNKTVVIATEPHRQAVLQQLLANEPDCEAAIS
jgi:hypothetical protein